MTTRPWTAGEVRRAVAWCRAGMSVAEIATALRRSKSGVYNQLGRHQVLQRHQRPGVTQPVADGDYELARRLLALEVVRAQAERATAPLYRHWPQGTWS
jgi:IS30 family transposase